MIRSNLIVRLFIENELYEVEHTGLWPQGSWEEGGGRCFWSVNQNRTVYSSERMNIQSWSVKYAKPRLYNNQTVIGYLGFRVKKSHENVRTMQWQYCSFTNNRLLLTTNIITSKQTTCYVLNLKPIDNCHEWCCYN